MRLICLFGLACCLSPITTLAQQGSPARIDGVVTDSVHGTALSGALVLLARRTSDITISSSTTTDAKGQFAFDDLPPGAYVVALESPLLDSLELPLPPTTVVLLPGERRHIALAVPSGATLRTLACPDVDLSPGIGAVAGRAYDALDGKALRGASLVIGWTETTVDRATFRATNVRQGAGVKTDSLGRFRICGVPTGTYLDVRASLDAYRELAIQVLVPDDAGVARQDLAFTPTERPARVEATASLSGIVYGATSPLSRVQLQLRGNAAVATTDSLGRYQFAAAPIGTQVLDVRRVGYQPRELNINVGPGENRAPDLHLTPITTLDSIRVIARRPRYREFDSRAKAASFGHFLRAEDIERRRPLLTSDLLRQMPGFRVVRGTTSDLDTKVVSSRGETSLHPKPCFAKIIIDGAAYQEINWIDPYSIGAMEIYPGFKTGPVQYQSECGTIIIWTKRY
jgi:hypothetical protein